MTQYAECFPEAPFVFYDHEVESHDLATMAEARTNPVARAILHREARRTRRAERAAVRQAAHVFAISAEDAELLRGDDPGLTDRVSVCPVPMPDAPPVPRRPVPDAFSALVLGPLHAGGRVDGLRWFLSAVWPSFAPPTPRHACWWWAPARPRTSGPAMARRGSRSEDSSRTWTAYWPRPTCA